MSDYKRDVRSRFLRNVSSSDITALLRKMIDSEDEITRLADETKREYVGTVGFFNSETKKWEGGITLKDSKQPQGSIGCWNSETKKWEKGIPESKLHPRVEQASVGYFDSDSQTWIGAEADAIRENTKNWTKTVASVLAKGKPLKVISGECKIEDCPSCFVENACPR